MRAPRFRRDRPGRHQRACPVERFDGERLSLEEDYEALSRRMQAAFEKKFFQADKAIYLGGISADPERPGFERSIIKPVIPKALKFVDASHQSMYGKIATSWKRTGQQLSPRVTVPPNTTALVYVPSSDGSVTESGKAAEKAAGVKFLRREGQAAVFEVGSGDYAFQSSL